MAEDKPREDQGFNPDKIAQMLRDAAKKDGTWDAKSPFSATGQVPPDPQPRFERTVAERLSASQPPPVLDGPDGTDPQEAIVEMLMRIDLQLSNVFELLRRTLEGGE